MYLVAVIFHLLVKSTSKGKIESYIKSLLYENFYYNYIKNNIMLLNQNNQYWQNEKG
jgi:hypothetical protein